MNFITLEDVCDEILNCTQADIDEANSFVSNTAKRLGVKTAQIKSPPVFTVKRLAVVYALYICAVRNIGKDNLTALDTESLRQDIYAQKAQFLKAELRQLETQVDFEDFTGKTSGLESCCIAVVRRA